MNSFVKSFVYPFIISIIIFTTLAYFFVGPMVDLIFSEDSTSENDLGNDSSENSQNSGASLKSNASGCLSLLLIGTDEIVYSDEQPNSPDSSSTSPDTDDNASLKNEFGTLVDKYSAKPSRSVEFITLVSFNSTLENVTITSIPAEAQVYVSDVKLSMNDAYYYIENKMFGLDYSYFAEYVTSITGCYIDYYSYIDIDDYIVIADQLGKIPVTLGEAANKTDEFGNTVYSYPASEQRLSSSDLRNLIKHESFDNVFTKANLLTEVSNYVLNRTATTGYYINFDSKFTDILSKLYITNVTLDSIKPQIPLYFSYSFYTVNPLNIIGDLTVQNEKLILTVNKDSTLKLFKQK